MKSQHIPGRITIRLLLGLSVLFFGGCRAAHVEEIFGFEGAARATLLPTGSTSPQAGLPFQVSTVSTINGTPLVRNNPTGNATQRFGYQTSPAPVFPETTPTTLVYFGTATPGIRQPTVNAPTATLSPTLPATMPPSPTLPATMPPSPTATTTAVPTDPWSGSWSFYAEISQGDYQNAQAEIKIENGTASGAFDLNEEPFTFTGDFIQDPQILNGVYTWGNTEGWFSWKISIDGHFFQGSLDNKIPFCAARSGVQRPEPCAYYVPY